MEFKDLVLGETLFANKIMAYQTSTIRAQTWLYLVGGIYGNDGEGIYAVSQLFQWLKNSPQINIPTIVIPILNIDGYQSHTRLNSRNVDINKNFPIATNRRIALNKSSAMDNGALKEAESFYLKRFLDEYPPELLISFQSNIKGQICPLGDSALQVGEFLARYNRYELVDDYVPGEGTLEAFIHDFYLSQAICLKIEKSSKDKTYQQIWEENATGLQNLLNVQAY
jgi:protein MpaA